MHQETLSLVLLFLCFTVKEFSSPHVAIHTSQGKKCFPSGVGITATHKVRN